jgi:RHS repeat-associated protein
VTQSGTIVNRNYFYPFGGNRGGAAFSSLTTKRFTGQYHEASLPGGEGLSYYGARWYDAKLARFLTPDSIVPDTANPQDWNRYTYVRNNPAKLIDHSGHCPTPPQEMGATICIALFIKPPSISAAPGITVHGDGRDFSRNSAPSASRGYAWISLDTGEIRTHMNDSGYHLPAWRSAPFPADSVPMSPIRAPSGTTVQWFKPSDKNTWEVKRAANGAIQVRYDLVISGPLDWSGAAPHINGEMTLRQVSKGRFTYSFVRDGFPWAEAYYHDGKGNVSTIFRDPAVRANPHDLFAIEPNIGFPRMVTRLLGGLTNGNPLISRTPDPACFPGRPC